MGSHASSSLIWLTGSGCGSFNPVYQALTVSEKVTVTSGYAHPC
jgi:hypothetical protein